MRSRRKTLIPKASKVAKWAGKKASTKCVKKLRRNRRRNKKPAGSAMVPAVPSTNNDGIILASAARHAPGIIMTAFEAIGGQETLNEQAAKDPKWFYEKLFTKVIPRVEPKKEEKDDFESLLSEAIDAEATEVVDAEFEDAPATDKPAGETE